MVSFQSTIVTIELIFLLGVLIVCTSGAIHIFSSRSLRLPKYIGGILLVVAVGCFYLLINLVILGQKINPLCAGIGDPQYMLCAGRGMIPHEEALSIMTTELISDLVRWVAVPSILGVGVLTVILRRRDSSVR